MSSIGNVPLASGDLELIAEVLRKIDEDRSGIFSSPILGKIEVFRDGDANDLIGYLVPFDDWYGFVPLSV